MTVYYKNLIISFHNIHEIVTSHTLFCQIHLLQPIVQPMGVPVTLGSAPRPNPTHLPFTCHPNSSLTRLQSAGLMAGSPVISYFCIIFLKTCKRSFTTSMHLCGLQRHNLKLLGLIAKPITRPHVILVCSPVAG